MVIYCYQNYFLEEQFKLAATEKSNLSKINIFTRGLCANACTSCSVTCDAPASDRLNNEAIFLQYVNKKHYCHLRTISKIVSNLICCFAHSLRRYPWRTALLNKYSIMLTNEYLKNQTIGLWKLKNKKLHDLASSLYLFIALIWHKY